MRLYTSSGIDIVDVQTTFIGGALDQSLGAKISAISDVYRYRIRACRRGLPCLALRSALTCGGVAL
ncbi:MAG: hypothetical protein WBC92_03455 [Terracidiphilus sp.]